jgi:hypothetical protein
MTRLTTDIFDSDKYYIHHTEDVEPLLDHLKEQRNHHDQNAWKKNDANWRKVGEIPMLIIEQWLHEGFNALAPDAGPEVIRRLQRDYPHLLAVNKL